MSDDPYIARQRERDAEHARDYAKWVATLSPEERASLREQGLDTPMISYRAGGEFDVASSNRDFTDSWGDKKDAIIQTAPSQAVDIQAALRRLVGELIGQDNAKLSIECLAIVTGLVYDGDSMTTVARRHRVHRATVSARCISLSQALNLPPARAMRTVKARQSYRKARTLHLRTNS
jgi:hypothetical protein